MSPLIVATPEKSLRELWLQALKDISARAYKRDTILQKRPMILRTSGLVLKEPQLGELLLKAL